MKSKSNKFAAFLAGALMLTACSGGVDPNTRNDSRSGLTPEEEQCGCDGVQPAIARICADGSTGVYYCGLDAEGVCESGFACPEDDCDCGVAPGAAWMCEDGSTGTYECVHHDDGTCGYEPTCGGGGGTAPGHPPTDGCGDPGELCDECGPLPAIARICDDGSTADAVCRAAEDGTCGWSFECAE